MRKRKTKRDIMKTQRVIRMFRSRAIVFLKTKGHRFCETPNNITLFDLIEQELGLERGLTRTEKFETYTELLNSQMDFRGKLSKAKQKKEYQAFYESRQWQELRYEALRVSSGQCELCGASKSTGAVLHVDHIKPRSLHPDLALELSNLQVLCKPCNLGKSNKDETDWRQ